MKAGVLEEEDAAVFERGDGVGDLRSDAVLQRGHWEAQLLRHARRHRREAHPLTLLISLGLLRPA